MGGAGGGATGGAGGAPPAGPGCPTGAIFCADFETGDAVPAGSEFFPAYQRANVANYLSLDTTVKNRGMKSLKVTGTDFSQMVGAPTKGSTFWVRFYMRMNLDTQMGHNTFVAAAEGDADPNTNDQIRIGEHQCQLELNRRSDDKEILSNGGMYQCSGGIVLKKDTWYCLEALYDGPKKEVRVFVDSTEVTALHVTDWGPYNYTTFKFGYEKYHGHGAGARLIWYDDVAIATQRVGCLAP